MASVNNLHCSKTQDPHPLDLWTSRKMSVGVIAFQFSPQYSRETAGPATYWCSRNSDFARATSQLDYFIAWDH